MPMRLVKKRSPRGRLSRQLSEEEESAVQKIYGRREIGSHAEGALVLHVLTEMRQTDTWLACSCVAGDMPPMNSANLLRDTGSIYLRTFTTPHAVTGPVFREQEVDDDTTMATGEKRRL